MDKNGEPTPGALPTGRSRLGEGVSRMAARIHAEHLTPQQRREWGVKPTHNFSKHDVRS